jgi:hypothetical protein
VSGAAAAAVLIAAGLTTLMTGRHDGTSAASGGHHAGANLSAVATANRQHAADWIASQVSQTATVSCDPAMCKALRAAKFLGDLLLLSRDANLLDAALMVATPVVRASLGTRLDSVAPGLIASFGTGRLAVEIRAIAQHGAAAYWSAVKRDQAARQLSESAFSRAVSASPSAHRALAAGAVDPRLVIALTNLEADEACYVVQLRSAPYAARGTLLRTADLAQIGRSGTISSSISPGFVRSVITILQVIGPAYSAARVSTIRLSTGQTVLRIMFPAPSPPPGT